MKVIYANQPAPEVVTKSIFLVGPTPRVFQGESWRPAMIAALERAGYDGVVYVPEAEDGEWKHSYDNQIAWEQKYLHQCDVVLAWVPRDLETMPAFTTNVEFGEFLASGKMIYGRPEGAPKTRYLDSRYSELWNRQPLTSLADLAAVATEKLRIGFTQTRARHGGERAVPMDVWKTKQFQTWYKAQCEAGNRLNDAKVLWSFYVGPEKDFLFCFTLWVDVWIESEQRSKVNEFIFSRTDISTIVAYCKEIDSPNRTRVVLVKEFRSPARTQDGFIRELPGGSSFKPTEEPLTVASHELEEETSLRIDPSRFRLVSTRQVAGTLSTHVATLFAVHLSDAEMERACEIAKSGRHFGVEGDSERTYVEVRSLKEILDENLLDWAQIGMIMQVLS